MTVKQARHIALAKYKKHKLTSWIIGVAFSLFSAAVISLNFLVTGISMITIPLLVLPFFFACVVLDTGYQEGLDLTFPNFLRSFALYFRRPFNGSFSVIRSFLKSLLVFVGALIVSSFVWELIYEAKFGDEFIAQVNALAESLYSMEADIERFYSILLEDDAMLMNFYMSVIEGPMYLSIFFFVYLTAKESVSIFLRLKMPKSNSSMVKTIYNRAIQKNRKEFYKLFWGLNWPYYLLLLLGFVGGGLFITFTEWDPFRSITLSTMIGFFLAGFFLPFFISNNCTIHEYFEPKYNDAMNDIVNDIIRRVEVLNEMTPEEKEKLAKNIRETGDPLGGTENKEDSDE